MKKILYILFYFLLSTNCVAQPLNFYKSYFNTGWHEGINFLELPDSGFIVIGASGPSNNTNYPFLMRINKYGDTLWTKVYSNLYEIPTGIAEYDDSSFVVSRGFKSTSNLDIIVTRFNLQGDTIEKREYGYNNNGWANNLTKCNDNGFIVHSYRQYDYGILKLDSNLNEEWHTDDYMYQGVTNVRNDPFGDFVVTGGGLPGANPYEVSRLDSVGNTIWHRYYGSNPPGNTYSYFATNVVFTSDSNYLVSCNGWPWQLMKINRINGDTLWTKNYSDSDYVSHKAINRMIDAGNNRYMCLRLLDCLLVDSNGDTIRSYKINDLTQSVFNCILQTNDGGYAFCGKGPNGIPGVAVLIFLKMDSIGNFVNTALFDLSNNFKQLTLYPNPTQSELNISTTAFSPSEKLTISLFDMQGRKMQQSNYTPNQPINISTLPPGMYAVEISGKEKVVRQKLVKE